MGSLSRPHFVIFPFMAQGHTIPLLHLSRLLLRHSAAVTIYTTAGNAPSIRSHLQNTDIAIIELPFPQNIPHVPVGVENTHNLPSMSSFLPFAKSTKLMQTSFEQSLQTLTPPVSCVISDAFLGWTLHSAHKFNLPRLVFFGTSNFSCTMYQILGREKPHKDTTSVDQPFHMPGFPNLLLTRNDFDPPYNEIEPEGEYIDFMMEQIIAMSMSQGMVVNSFYELEKCYIDYWNEKIGPKAFPVGPLCLVAEAPPPPPEKLSYIEFLDGKLMNGEDVLYVAFGTQATVSPEQVKEVAEGLERAQVSFLWALKEKMGFEFMNEFEEKVKGRGMVVSEWVDQVGILRHGGVKGFLSHGGWNSVLESISAAVPMVVMPLMAEQHLNARLVAEVVGVGVRVMAEGGSVRGFVKAEEVERKVREVMVDGESIRLKVAEMAEAARAAVQDGGESMRTLELMMDEVCRGSVGGKSCKEVTVHDI